MRIIVIRPKYKDEVSITVDDDDLTVDQFVNDLVRPTMLALGYQPGNLDELFGEL